jgi:hypothetical protein
MKLVKEATSAAETKKDKERDAGARPAAGAAVLAA